MNIDSIKRDKLNILINVGLLINSDYSDLNSLLEKIIKSAMDVVDGEAASLLILDSDKQKLRFEIAIGPKGIEAKKVVLNSNQGIAGWTVKNNKTLIVNDVLHDSRFDATVQETTGYETRNLISVPMRLANGECIGAIEVLNKKSGEGFDFEDSVVLELFANQTAIAYQNASHYRKSEDEIISLQDKLTQDRGYHTLVVNSKIMLEKLELCRKVAESDASVLILGESGVGKELIAEYLHFHSKRVNKPFIRVNCAALSEGLLESELFGHVRGAFTDAVSDRIGRFETADSGTIFLDEISDIPLNLQTKLLRVLQEMSFERVGSNKTIRVDVRVIAATNKDIEKLVYEGKFRADLYYRLNVLPIYIPALRSRTEDIPELANFFLKKFSKEVKKNFLSFSEIAMTSMKLYDWPGNVRELENVVERACVLGSPPYIEQKDLMLKPEFIYSPAGKMLFMETATLKNAIDEFKKNYIVMVLEKNGWNQTVTAEVLDIQRTYLSRLLNKFKIREM